MIADLKFAIIAYGDATGDIVTHSIYESRDYMPRSVRGTDYVIAVFNNANASTYSSYITKPYSQLSGLLETPDWNQSVPVSESKFIEVKGDVLDITSSEIYDISIISGGTGYSDGNLTATGGGGSGFAGTYSVDSGVVDKVKINKPGSGYTSTPTIVLSAGGSGATLRPALRSDGTDTQESEGLTRVLNLSLNTLEETLIIDKDTSGDSAEDAKGLSIDFDRTVAGSGTAAHNDIGIDLNINSASLGTSTVKGIDVAVVGATSGTHTATGIDMTVSGADTNIGLNLRTHGTHLKLLYDVDNYTTFAVGSDGDLTIATIDNGMATVGNITLDADGAVILDPTNGITKFYKAGDTDDLCTLTVAANGATTIATADSDGVAGHLTLDIDGDITLDADGGDITFSDAGTDVVAFDLANKRHLLKYDSGNFFRTTVAADGATTLETVDSDGEAGHLTLDVDGDIILDADGGNITLQDGGSTYTPSASSDAATKSYVDTTQYCTLVAGMNYNLTGGTFCVISLSGATRPLTSFAYSTENTAMIAPFDGSLEKIMFRCEEVAGDPVAIGFHKATTGTEYPSNTPTTTVSIDMSGVADDTSTEFAFSSSNTFSKGDVIGFSIDPDNDINDAMFTIVLKYDVTT